MRIKRSAILILSVLFLLATSAFAQAGPRYYGGHHGYTHHSNHTIVIESHDYYPEYHYNDHHRSSYGHGYGHHSPRHIYVEKHVYRHESPRVVYQQPQPTYYPPANNYRGGNIVGDTLIGGALGAAAGAAIGAVTGNPAAGAQIGAVVGGFGGISRGILGRGLIW